jgi:site-specific recombinase XerD
MVARAATNLAHMPTTPAGRASPGALVKLYQRLPDQGLACAQAWRAMTEPGAGDELERFSFWLRYPANGRKPMGEGTVRTYLYTVRRFHRFLQVHLSGAGLSEGSAGIAQRNESKERKVDLCGAGISERSESNERKERAIDQGTAEEFVRQLEADGNSSRSVGRHINALRAYFAFKGVVLDLGAPAFLKRLPRWLTDEEWASVLETAERPLRDKRFPDRARVKALFKRAALMVYGGAGLRLSEGCGLKREDVDPTGHLRVLSKGGQEDIVPVENAVVSAISDWVATHDSPWVFPGRGVGHLGPRTMPAAIRQILVDAGITNIHRAVHSLRHTFGADLRKRGADIRDIQEVLRHADIGTTQIYTHMAREDLRKKLPRRFVDQQTSQDGDDPEV